MHRPVLGPLTLVFVAVTDVWLFFPQLTRNGVDLKAIGELNFDGYFVFLGPKVISWSSTEAE